MKNRLTLNFQLFLSGLALLTVVLFVSTRAIAADINGTFAYPTQFEDGSALGLSQIERVRVEYGSCVGTAFGTKAGEVSVTPPTTAFTVTGLSPGTYCLRAYTRTTAAAGGLDSAPTGVVTKVIPFPPPKPPVLVTVAVMVWETKIHPTQGLVAGRQVGTAEIGATCYADENGQPFVGDDLYRVRLSSVKLTKTPRSELLVARCVESAG